MCFKNQFQKIMNVLTLFFVIFCIISVFMRPEIAFEGIMLGLNDCYNRIIPSLFPFMVLSGILMASPLAKYLGVIFFPYAKALKIKNRRVPLAILLSLIGGFAVCANVISNLFADKEITKRDAELLLCCCVGAGPAFTISAIGYSMLNSKKTGIIIYTCLLLSNLITGIILSVIMPKNSMLSDKALHQIQSKTNAVKIIENSTASILVLCGFITIFRFFTAIITPPNANNAIKFIVAGLFEITSGCSAAMNCGAMKAYCACGALSVMGMSVFMQVKYICKEEISIMPLLLSRLLHLPLALCFLKLAFVFFPYATDVYVGEKLFMGYYRMPADAMLIIFLLCIAIFFDFAVPNHLRKRFKSL
ncbi:MAG: hypothetical protein RSE10_02330 [Oscillospiraceae bacterium]